MLHLAASGSRYLATVRRCAASSRLRSESVSRRKVVVITGGSAGVGRATAQEFARQGAAIGLLARGKDGLRGAARDVERLGGAALPITLDVADAEKVEAAAAAVEKQFGPIDVWV